jgi:hypothetical protein
MTLDVSQTLGHDGEVVERPVQDIGMRRRG